MNSTIKRSILLLLTFTISCSVHEEQDGLIKKLAGQTSDNAPIYLEFHTNKLGRFTNDLTVYKGFKIIKGDKTIVVDSTKSIVTDSSKINWIRYKNIDYLILEEWDPIENDNHLIFRLRQYPENCVNEVRQKDRTFYIRLKNTQL
jgi:hypothetical protein